MKVQLIDGFDYKTGKDGHILFLRHEHYRALSTSGSAAYGNLNPLRWFIRMVDLIAWRHPAAHTIRTFLFAISCAGLGVGIGAALLWTVMA